MYKKHEYKKLIGKTFVSVENDNDEKLIFTSNKGEKFMFYHDQDCCESVTINDIIGDLNNLIESPLLMAEEVSYSDKNPAGIEIPKNQDSFTWTFYKFATMKGYVTVRWYGESNGYYSERVNFGFFNEEEVGDIIEIEIKE